MGTRVSNLNVFEYVHGRITTSARWEILLRDEREYVELDVLRIRLFGLVRN